MKYKRIGDLLLSVGLVTEEQIAEALEIQKDTKDRLGKILLDNGFITESQFIEAFRMQLGIEYIDLAVYRIPPEMAEVLPKQIAKKYEVVPVRVEKDSLYLAMKDPLNFLAIEEVRNITKKKIVPMIATEAAVDRAISALYGTEGAAKAMAQMRREAGYKEDTEAVIQQEAADAAAAPTIRLVNSIIERGASSGASDIHFEPQEGDMVVRMRIDGKLHQILTIPRDLQDAVTSRLKVMGGMKLAERRIPQDGRAELKIKTNSVDLRMSTLPGIFGEKTVIRLLTRDENLLNRAGLGIRGADSEKLTELLGYTSGVIMIVGPTGSGKSSTMYSIIKELKSEETNLVTLEDPVEYNIQGVTQVQINEKTGLTFAEGLRAILRQDPDIICVGEIRDGETAEIAMRAAMTGHLVITTIHTEDAVSAIDRLKDMGVEAYLISSGVRGIISQRLVRRICPNCRESYDPEPDGFRMAGLVKKEGTTYYRGRGCASCFNTGYKGRIGVYEILRMSDEVRDGITAGKTKKELREMLRDENFVSLKHNAERLIEEGITTIDEVCHAISRAD